MLKIISDSLEKHSEFNQLFNWSEISRLPELTDEFIRKHSQLLDFGVLCQTQSLSLDIINEFENKIDYSTLVKNPNLSEDVLLAKVDKMDWELFQMNQPFSHELLEKYRDRVQLMIIFKYQKLSEETILSFLKPYIAGQQYAMLKGLLDLVFQYQVVSEDFIRAMLGLEYSVIEEIAPSTSQCEPVPPKRKQILVSLSLIVRYQKLSEEFLLSTLSGCDKETLIELCSYQTINRTMIVMLMDSSILTEKTKYKIIAAILQYQKLDQKDLLDILQWIVSPARVSTLSLRSACELRYFTLAFNNQTYDYETFIEMLAIAPEQVKPDAYISLFLRYLVQDTDTTNLVDKIDWYKLSSRTLKPDEVFTLLRPERDYNKKICWYFFLKNNHLEEDVIESELVQSNIGAIEWWLLLSGKHSEQFMSRHKDKKNWWKFIPVEEQAEFFQNCLESITDLNSEHQLPMFLRDFVTQSDWAYILRYEALDEWFIRLFQHFEKDIPLFWWKICRYQKLPETFIRKHMANLDLNIVLTHQVLSMEFIEEYVPFFEDDCWDKVKKFQTLTGEFCNKYAAFLL
jgi:hypothetical protein